MSHPRRRRSSSKPGSKKPQTGAPKGVQNRPNRKAGPQNRLRWFYDVRQYAILTDESGHFLILQLPAKYDETAANAWTLPGGKLEPDDIPGEGLLREIEEETDLKATLVGPVSVARWTTRNSKKLGIFYKATVPGTRPQPILSKEHQRAFWITLDELADYPFHRQDMVNVLRTVLGSTPTP